MKKTKAKDLKHGDVIVDDVYKGAAWVVLKESGKDNLYAPYILSDCTPCMYTLKGTKTEFYVLFNVGALVAKTKVFLNKEKGKMTVKKRIL